MKLTYGNLRDQNFGKGMMKLANCALFKTPKVAINIARINALFTEEAKLSDDLYQKLVNEYAQKDDKGEILPHDGKKGTFFIPEANVAEWAEKMKEFMAIEFEINRPRIHLDDVMVAGLTPAEINALDPILHYSEETLAEVKPL